jgi:hypothetical protein
MGGNRRTTSGVGDYDGDDDADVGERMKFEADQ